MKKSYKEKIEYLKSGFSAASGINAENLRRILYDNKDTALGKRYAFSELTDAEGFAARVPLSDYSDYEGKICRYNECVAYPVKCLLGTSGTTGRQKHFPLTEEALRRYSSYIFDMPYFLTGAEGKSLHTSVFRGKSRITLLSSAYYSYLEEIGALDCDDFVGGRELLFSDRISDVKYVKAWLMLAHPETVSVQSVFLYDLLLILRYLEENWRVLIDDMRSRRVSVPLDGGIKEALCRNFADEGRLSYLEELFGRGEGFVLSDILPRVRFISGIGGRVYEIQEAALKKYIGDVPIYYFAYASSECMMGVARAMNEAEYVLLPDSAYYEFLPLDGGEPVSLENIAVGESYEPVVTTFSGLYRYRTGDVIRILSFEGESPVFEFVTRRNGTVNIAGEKLDSNTVTAAVARFAESATISVFDYALGIDDASVPFGYALFIEADRLPGGARELFDSVLRKLSVDYDDVRELGMLSSPGVYLLGTGEIAKRCANGGHNAHGKPHSLIDARAVRELINSAKE